MAETTEYHILMLEDEGSWTSLGWVNAHSAEDAIRRTAAPSNGPQTYVAVPKRSFKPVTVRIEQKTVLHLDTPPAE